MARTIKKLVAVNLPRLSPGRHLDGDGLTLIVDAPGTGRWEYRYRHNGKQREMGLGSFPGVTLAQARQLSDDARAARARGQDPIEERKAKRQRSEAEGITFGAFADQHCSDHERGLRNAKHRAQWRMTLGDKYCKAIRSKPIGAISTEDVLAVLQPVWMTVPETARRLRMRLERVLDVAKVRGLRSGENPARWKGHLDLTLPNRPGGAKKHFAAMSHDEVPAFLARLRQLDNVAPSALEFLILTAARTGEVIDARWDEFDLVRKVWTIPAGRMKAGREHRVPLSEAALAVLTKMKGIHQEFVFPGWTGKAGLSNMALEKVLHRLGIKGDVATEHGFRSSFRDWAAEKTSYSNEVVEMALAHAIKNQTEAAYRRGDLLEKRREVMTAWANFLAGKLGAKIVQLAGIGPQRATEEGEAA